MKDLASMPESELISQILKGVLPHEVLLIERDTGLSEAKAQYKQIALRLHPDKNQGAIACEAFKHVSNALQSYLPAHTSQTRWSDFQPATTSEPPGAPTVKEYTSLAFEYLAQYRLIDHQIIYQKRNLNAECEVSQAPRPKKTAWHNQAPKRRRVSVEAPPPHPSPMDPSGTARPARDSSCATANAPEKPVKDRWSRQRHTTRDHSQAAFGGFGQSQGSSQEGSQRSVPSLQDNGKAYPGFEFRTSRGKDPSACIASAVGFVYEGAGGSDEHGTLRTGEMERGGEVGDVAASVRDRWGYARRLVRQERSVCSPSSSGTSSSLDNLPECESEDGDSSGRLQERQWPDRQRVVSLAPIAGRKPVGRRLYKQIDMAPT